eukprot:evm.model.NODE_46620_length_32521_cov_40.639156.7
MLAAIASQHEHVEASMKLPLGTSSLSSLPSSPPVGNVVVIRRNGKDGGHFPLSRGQATIGRHEGCDIRIALPWVSRKHAELRVEEVEEDEEVVVTLTNYSEVNPTMVNGKKLSKGNKKSTVRLEHGDVFVVADRSFRFEYLQPQREEEEEKEEGDSDATQVMNERAAANRMAQVLGGGGGGGRRASLRRASLLDKENLASPSKVIMEEDAGAPFSALKPSRRGSLGSSAKKVGNGNGPPSLPPSSPAAPLRPSQLTNHATPKPAPASAKKASPSPPPSSSTKARLATPLRKSIDARGQSSSSSGPSLPPSTPGVKIVPMPTPLKRAIQARRQSYTPSSLPSSLPAPPSNPVTPGGENKNTSSSSSSSNSNSRQQASYSFAQCH